MVLAKAPFSPAQSGVDTTLHMIACLRQAPKGEVSTARLMWAVLSALPMVQVREATVRQSQRLSMQRNATWNTRPRRPLSSFSNSIGPEHTSCGGTDTWWRLKTAPYMNLQIERAMRRAIKRPRWKTSLNGLPCPTTRIKVSLFESSSRDMAYV